MCQGTLVGILAVTSKRSWVATRQRLGRLPQGRSTSRSGVSMGGNGTSDKIMGTPPVHRDRDAEAERLSGRRHRMQ